MFDDTIKFEVAYDKDGDGEISTLVVEARNKSHAAKLALVIITEFRYVVHIKPLNEDFWDRGALKKHSYVRGKKQTYPQPVTQTSFYQSPSSVLVPLSKDVSIVEKDCSNEDWIVQGITEVYDVSTIPNDIEWDKSKCCCCKALIDEESLDKMTCSWCGVPFCEECFYPPQETT